MRARAFIAVPLPPPATWALLRDPSELPDGFTIVGSLEVGRAERPALDVQTPAERMRGQLIGQLEADGIAVEQWRALFALYVRMSAEQRAQLIAYAQRLLEAGPA
jgi:hypothetical protein